MTIFDFLLFVILPLIVIGVIIDRIFESEERMVRRLRRSGLSQRAIAARTGLTRYRVRKCLA